MTDKLSAEKETIAILIVEDNPADAVLIEEMLTGDGGQSFSMRVADRLSSALTELGSLPAQVVLLDLGLPDSSGLKALLSIQEKVPEAAVIIITGLADEGLAIQALHSGAQDYLIKGRIDRQLLSRSVRYSKERKELYEECEIARKELGKKSEELEKSNRDLELFASIASHDLQEPLISLGANLKLFERRMRGAVHDEETREFLSGAVDAASRMQKMVRNLLAYSKVGRKTASFEKADLNSILDLALKNLQAVIDKNGAVITRTPLPEASVDPILLSQLFQNLIANSIKYKGEETPKIHIAVERNEKEHQFCVSDNGMGIPPEYGEAVFQIFKRLPGGEKRAGTGIGLATCKKIVELHGGRIWFESGPGRGSKFYFTVPFSE